MQICLLRFCIFKMNTLFLNELIFMVLLGTFWASAGPSSDTQPLIVETQVGSIHPGQDGIGLSALIKTEIDPLLARADGNPLIAMQALSGKALTGFIAPDGVVWLTDGHHRWIKKYLLAKMADVVPCTRIRVKILKDFTGEKWDDFYLMIEKRIFLKKSVRESLIPLSDKVKTMPSSAEELLQRDSPTRSLIKIAFKQLNISSSSLRDFSELMMGEQLESQGFVVKESKEMSQESALLAMRLILSPENREFLLSLFKDGPNSESARKSLEKANIKYTRQIPDSCLKFYH